MISRRIAFAVGLLCAILASQLPEFLQQYRQRLGGAIDELSSIVTRFDQSAGALALSREQGIARLKGNDDPLAREQGEGLADVVARKDRLQRQQIAFAVSGPVSQYAVLAEDLDVATARQTLGSFQLAVPLTPSAFLIAVLGFLLGWLVTLALTLPARRPGPKAVQAAAWH